MVVPDLLADLLDRLGDEVSGVPVARAAADFVDEIAQQMQPVGGMHDLRVELDTEAQLVVAHGRDGDAVGSGEGAEAVGHPVDSVSVRHPDGHRAGEVVEQRGLVSRIDVGGSELALAAALDTAAELVGHGLHAVTDAEHRHPAVESPVRGGRRAVVVDAGGSAAEDDAARVHFLDPIPGRVRRDQFAIDIELADSTCDEHRSLGAEVDNDDRFVLGFNGLHVIMICAQ